MAYSAIVNVPPVASLWAALAAIVAYVVLGSSRILSRTRVHDRPDQRGDCPAGRAEP